MTRTDPPGPADIGAITDPRERLVAAAAAMLHDDLFEVICDGLRPEQLTRAAGRSRRVFYDHFDERADVLRAVALRHLEPGVGSLTALPDDLGAAFDFVEGDLISGAGLLVDATFDEMLASADPAMRVFAWCVGRDDDVIGDALRHHQRVSDDAIGDLLERLNAAIGLCFRPPWDGRRMAAAMRALADGLYMRHHLGEVDSSPDPTDRARDRTQDPGRTSAPTDRRATDIRAPAATADMAELLTLTALSLLPVATQPAGAPDVPVFDHLEGFAHALSTAWREGVEVDQLLDARERVLSALRTTIARSGPVVDLEAVAATAGLSMRSVVAAFGSLAELVEAAIDESLPALDREVDFDIAAGDIGLADMVRRHLLRVGQWARSEPELARLWSASATGAVAAIESTTAQRFSERLAAPLITMLGEAHRLRSDEPDPPIAATAAMATDVLVGRMIEGSDDGLDAASAWLTDVVLRTLRLD